MPAKFSQTLLWNLDQANRNGIVLSWAIPKQGGHGHINELANEDVIRMLSSLGYSYDVNLSVEARNAATLQWLKNTVMIFRRITLLKI